MPGSTIIFVTRNSLPSRYIAWWTRGFAHVALVSDRRPGMWLDARHGGVMYREPETNLHAYQTIRLPFDIEDAARRHIGEGFNYRGLIAAYFHFRWASSGRYCAQSILRWIAESGHPIIDESLEDEIDPVRCRDLITAYMRGLERNPLAA